MAGNFHPANVDYDPAGVDAAPSTQAPNDYFSVHANPDDFGAQVGQAFQHLGAGVRSAAEDFGQIQQLHNEASVNAALTSYMQGNQQLLYSAPQTDAKGNPVPNTGGYFSQNGANAVNGYQNTLAAADQNYQSARANLNPRQQVMFDQLARRMHQSTLMEIGQHSTRQGEAWQDQQTQSFISTTSDAAVQAAMSGKADDFDHYLDQGQSAAIHWSDLKGYGSDFGQQQASKFVGGTVANAAKQFIDQGNPAAAQSLFDKYKDRMDKGSALAVEGALKTHIRDVNAQSEADVALGKMGIGAGAVSDHGNGQGAAPAQAAASTPVPKEYADKGITQDQWDQMNAPDQAPAAAVPPAPAPTPSEQPGPGSQSAGVGPTPSHAAPGGSNLDAASVLRHFEGFRSSPYWDVNALRVGYGSDTITKADGSVQRVTSGTRITREDAERDLQRRAAISANSASNSVGAQQWAQLPGPAQAALTSLTYNYGHLPESVAAAAKTGDVNKIADAVEALKGANGGVNADRREKEATIIRGGGFPGGPAPSVAQQGPNISPQGRQLLMDPLSANGTVMPMMTGSSGQPTDIGATHEQKADLLQDKATVISDIRQKYTNDPQMADAIISRVNQGVSTQMLNQQAAQQQALAAQDAGYNKYYTSLLKGAKGDDLVQQIANDNSLTGTTKEHLVNAIQTYGQGKALGSDFYSYFQRVHSNGADKITSPDQIYASVDGQHLTIEGADKIRQELAGRKTIDGEAISDMQKGALAYIKHNLSFEADYGTFKIPDPKGQDIFNSQAIPAFYKAIKDGQDAGKSMFDLLTPGSKDYIGDKIIQTFKRNPAQEQKDYIAAGGDANGTGVTPAAPAASTFNLKNYNVATPEGQSQAANAIKADLDSGSISRVEAVSRLNALRAAAAASVPNTPQVPNSP